MTTPPVLPVDPLYLQQQGLAQHEYGNNLLDVHQDRLDLTSEYGFAGVGEDGSQIQGPMTAFNRAAMLQRRYDQLQAGTTNSYAARGQLYAGSHRRALGSVAFDRLRDEHALRSDFDRQFNDTRRRRRAADLTLAHSNLDAQLGAIGRATDPSSIDPSTVAPPGAPAPAPNVPAGAPPQFASWSPAMRQRWLNRQRRRRRGGR